AGVAQAPFSNEGSDIVMGATDGYTTGDSHVMLAAAGGGSDGGHPHRRKPLDDERKQGAWALHEALAMFTRELRVDMPLQYVTSFLLVAMDEGKGVGEYAERAGVSKSVMSRHLLDIGPRMRNQSTGFGLVETRTNPEDYRAHSVYLTAKGRAMMERIVKFWQ